MPRKRKSLSKEVHELKEYIMATVPELMKAIETNGLAIVEAQKAVIDLNAQVKAALERAMAGAATPAQLQDAIDKLNASTELAVKTKETALQTVPTVESPDTPTPPVSELPDTTEPAPTPLPLPPSVDVIEITPAPDAGLDGTVNIDTP